MKKLISSPLDILLWLIGLLLLVWAGWRIVHLKLQGESNGHSANVSIEIPDSKVLDIPDLNNYPAIVQAPLFWASRKAYIPEPPKPAATAPAVAPVDTALPEGRLIGIIDLGSSLFALMQNKAGSSLKLRVGDTWGAWRVSGIDPDKLILSLNGQEKDIPLIGDLTTPQESPQVAQARVIQQQAKQQQSQQQTQPGAPVSAASPERPPQGIPPAGAANAESGPRKGAGLPYPAETAKQPPALSVKEALEARQRLMASRWGALTGDTSGNKVNESQPANSQQ